MTDTRRRWRPSTASAILPPELILRAAIPGRWRLLENPRGGGRPKPGRPDIVCAFRAKHQSTFARFFWAPVFQRRGNTGSLHAGLAPAGKSMLPREERPLRDHP